MQMQRWLHVSCLTRVWFLNSSQGPRRRHLVNDTCFLAIVHSTACAVDTLKTAVGSAACSACNGNPRNPFKLCQALQTLEPTVKLGKLCAAARLASQEALDHGSIACIDH